MGFTLRKEGSDFFNELFYHLPKEAKFITFGTEVTLAGTRASSEDLAHYYGRHCKK